MTTSAFTNPEITEAVENYLADKQLRYVVLTAVRKAMDRELKLDPIANHAGFTQTSAARVVDVFAKMLTRERQMQQVKELIDQINEAEKDDSTLNWRPWRICREGDPRA